MTLKSHIEHEHLYTISIDDHDGPITDEQPDNRFDTSIINAVWEKAQQEFGFVFFKRDRLGGVIAKHDYGKKTQYGWVILRTVPRSLGGTDDIENLRPYHWKHVPLKGE